MVASIETLFPVESSLHLPPNMNVWAEMIVNHLNSKFSALSDFIGEVHFKKVDKVGGNAIGFISLVGRTQRIPFIVNSFELAPLDIYIDGVNYLPLTERTIAQMLQKVWPFKLISERDRQSLMKTATQLTAIGRLETNFVNENKDLLQKIASEHPDVIQTLINVVDDDKATIVNNDVLHIFVKSASCDAPIVVENIKTGVQSTYTFTKFASEFNTEMLSNVMQGKEFYITPFESFNSLDLLSKETFEKVACSDDVVHMKYNADSIPGKIYPRYRLDTNSRYDNPESNIFISFCDKTKYKKGNTFNVVKLPHDNNGELRAHEPMSGDTACLIGNNKCYGPFTISGVENHEGKKIYRVHLNSLVDTKTYYLKPVFGLKKIVLDKNEIMIPDSYSFVSLKEEITSKKMVKTADIKVTVSKLLSGALKVDDNGVSGIDPKRLQNIDKSKAVGILMHCGLPEKEAKYAVEQALSTGSYSFSATTQLDNKKIDNTPSKIEEKTAEDIRKYASEGGLLKMAAFGNDSSNIDLALGLNLVTSQTVKRFALLIPDITKMLDSLCKFLMCKRMNSNLIPTSEQDITGAITSLDAIIQSLGSL